MFTKRMGSCTMVNSHLKRKPFTRYWSFQNKIRGLTFVLNFMSSKAQYILYRSDLSDIIFQKCSALLFSILALYSRFQFSLLQILVDWDLFKKRFHFHIHPRTLGHSTVKLGQTYDIVPVPQDGRGPHWEYWACVCVKKGSSCLQSGERRERQERRERESNPVPFRLSLPPSLLPFDSFDFHSAVAPLVHNHHHHPHPWSPAAVPSTLFPPKGRAFQEERTPLRWSIFKPPNFRARSSNVDSVDKSTRQSLSEPQRPPDHRFEARHLRSPTNPVCNYSINWIQRKIRCLPLKQMKWTPHRNFVGYRLVARILLDWDVLCEHFVGACKSCLNTSLNQNSLLIIFRNCMIKHNWRLEDKKSTEKVCTC